METKQRSFRTPACLLLIFTSGLVGSLIPSFYRWTDSDQSRPSPLLWQVPLGGALVSLGIGCALPWLPIRRREVEGLPDDPSHSPHQFGIRRILIGTTVVAVVAALLMKWPYFATTIISLASLYRFGHHLYQWKHRWIEPCALLACMLLPFAWVVLDAPSYLSKSEALGMLPVVPGLVPSLLLGRFIEANVQDQSWLPCLISSMQLLLGLWLIELGPRRAIAYMLAMQVMSGFGSLVLLQLMLA